MKYLLVLGFVAALIFLIVSRPNMKDHWDLGYEAGKKEALNIHRPTDDLEMACAALWVGKQNKIWSERNK